MEQKNGGKAFRPYIPPEKNQPELTTASVIVGILLAILAVAGIDRRIDLSGLLDTGIIGNAAAILIITAGVLWFARGKKGIIQGLQWQSRRKTIRSESRFDLSPPWRPQVNCH